MNPGELMAKARRAVASAQLLLTAGDEDGASNRAYYAMFDAARAALIASGIGEPESIRTHSGLITAFSLHLVKTGKVPLELGRAINKVEEIRLVADYKGEPADLEAVAWAVTQADTFVAYVAIHFDLG